MRRNCVHAGEDWVGGCYDERRRPLVSSPCKICDKRRGRRHCPGLDQGAGGEICAPCCGAERENSIDCPATCPFLRDARLHEVPPPIEMEQIPHIDIKLSEDFIRSNEALVFTLGLALKQSMEAKNAVDADAAEALEAMVQTYRTMESGLIYETRPANPYAAAIQEKMREGLEELQKALQENPQLQAAILPAGAQHLRDKDILGTLVFLQRLQIQYNNGRRRGRAFRDFLANYITGPAIPERDRQKEPGASSLIL
jgi:hypothetical protein